MRKAAVATIVFDVGSADRCHDIALPAFENSPDVRAGQYHKVIA
jgi:hypothetical protein